MALNTRPIPNLIQGVSQQVASQRRDTQAETQFDCVNSPVEGCLARPGSDLLKFIASVDWSDAFFYDIKRSATEWYLVVITPGSVRVFDQVDFTECTVTNHAGYDPAAYLTPASQPARDAFVAATIDDSTFLANRQIKPAMAATLSPARPSEALFHFRAGNYSTTYVISIVHAGVFYSWTYTTPDNSVASNGPYITTNQLAATFYRAMTGTPAYVPASGTSGLHGVKGVAAGDTNNVVATITATSLGFSVEINGNVLRVWRTSDNDDFEVDTSDGAGETMLKGFKGKATAFSDLPTRCFPDVVVKVQGQDKTSDDDYYVKYVLDGTGSGYWQETVAPATPYALDLDKMPNRLVNTDYRTFEMRRGLWGGRVVGDQTTAPDPSFVGRRLQRLSYDNSRLAILWEGGLAWSKSRNPYVFFPDTVQTVLDEAPVDTPVSGTEGIALLRTMVHAGGGTYIWGTDVQFAVTTGQEHFTQKTVDIRPSTNYEFNDKATPCGVAQSLFFATDTGEFSTIRDLYVPSSDTRAKPQDTDITAHVAQYVRSGVQWLVASDTFSTLFVTSRDDPANLYVYNWLLSKGERVQSAWNTWRLPALSTILWAGIYKSNLHLVIQTVGGVAAVEVPLKQNLKDAETGATYRTRMDFRVTEADLGVSYDAGLDITTFTVPYPVTGQTPFLVCVRDDVKAGAGGGYGRGRAIPIEAIPTPYTVAARGDWRDYHLYAGYGISSERTESQFYLRSDQGAIPADRLQVHWMEVLHARTGYYRAEVTQRNGQAHAATYDARILGDPSLRLDEVILGDGKLHIPVKAESSQVTIRLVNDSFLPSAWQSAVVAYDAVVRAPTGQQPQG